MLWLWGLVGLGDFLDTNHQPVLETPIYPSLETVVCQSVELMGKHNSRRVLVIVTTSDGGMDTRTFTLTPKAIHHRP